MGRCSSRGVLGGETLPGQTYKELISEMPTSEGRPSEMPTYEGRTYKELILEMPNSKELT